MDNLPGALYPVAGNTKGVTVNSKLAAAVGVIGMLVATNVLAEGALTGRVGVVAGKYNFEDEAVVGGSTASTDTDTTTYGIVAGSGFLTGPFFADLGLEYSLFSEDNSLDRTDLLLTGGMYLGDNWSLFGGYRYALFGDGFFSDDNGYRETGPYVGGGFSFQPGKTISMGTSLAVNFLSLESDDPFAQELFDAIDVFGFSLKVQLNVLESPHSFFFRAQDFEGDGDGEISGSSFTYDYSERYFIVGYQMNLVLSSW